MSTQTTMDPKTVKSLEQLRKQYEQNPTADFNTILKSAGIQQSDLGSLTPMLDHFARYVGSGQGGTFQNIPPNDQHNVVDAVYAAIAYWQPDAVGSSGGGGNR